MKKLFLLIAVLCISVSAFASEANRIYLGFEGETYSYREPYMDGPMHLTARKIGASFEWVGRSILAATGLKESDDNSFATFEVRYLNGKTDYDGFTWGGTPVTSNGWKDWYAEGRITLGQTYDVGNQFEFWPYMGFGYRYLLNDGSSVDTGSYKRISQYWYMPIGVKVKKGVNANFSLTLTGEFDWLLAGKQATDLGALYPALNSDYIYNFQPEGWGLRFGLKAEIQMSESIGFFLEPYYRFWKIQNSNLGETEQSGGIYYTGVPMIEPFNITKEAGIRAGFYF